MYPPSLVFQILTTGKKVSALGSMLGKAATYHEEIIDYLVDGLNSLMVPIIISFLEVVTGRLIIALHLPIFVLGDAVSDKQDAELGKDRS